MQSAKNLFLGELKSSFSLGLLLILYCICLNTKSSHFYLELRRLSQDVKELICLFVFQQPCHPCAGLSDGGDLWLRRVSQVCRRGSAGLHRLLNILRPYGTGSRRNGTKAVAETPCGASATDDSGLCEPKCSKEAVRFQPVFPFWGEAVQQKQQTGHSYK